MTSRKSAYPISPLILNRWSPRSLTARELTDDELFALFEAARWAPSSYNGQPWRFIVAKRQDEEKFKVLFNFLSEWNQSWAKNASALVVVCSHTHFEYNGKPSRTHAFDTGAAWENLALQAKHQGLIAHGMEGFDYDNAKAALNVPENMEVHAMIAIGEKGPNENLAEEFQKPEEPNDRRPLKEIVFNGSFGVEFTQI